MRRTALGTTMAAAMGVGLLHGSASAFYDEFIDPMALYEARSGSIELPDHGIRISHFEGNVTIERTADDEGGSFYVMQEFDEFGAIRFAGFSLAHDGGAVEELFGMLKILPDGSLRIEYDALGVENSGMSVSVTKFAVPGTVLVTRRVCECSDPNIGGCVTNDCHTGSRCSQDPQDPSTNKCKWSSIQVLVQTVSNP